MLGCVRKQASDGLELISPGAQSLNGRLLYLGKRGCSLILFMLFFFSYTVLSAILALTESRIPLNLVLGRNKIVALSISS